MTGSAGGLTMQIGYKLASEAFDPQELIRQAVLAEQSGFDFVEMSDRYHPWLDVPVAGRVPVLRGQVPAGRPAVRQRRL